MENEYLCTRENNCIMKRKHIFVTFLLAVGALAASAQERLIVLDSERLALRNNNAKRSFFYQQMAELLTPQKAAWSVLRVPSNSKEAALAYDSLANVLVYKVAESTIWGATRKENYVAPEVKTFTLRIDTEKAMKLRTLIQAAVVAAEDREDNQLDGIKWEYCCDGQRAYTQNHNSVMAKFTDELMETVGKGDASRAGTLIDDAFQQFMQTINHTNPQFPGGEKALQKFLKKNLTYPEAASAYGVEGSVVMTFIVDEDGLLKDIAAHDCKIDRFNTTRFSQETESRQKELKEQFALMFAKEGARCIRKMPKWSPATIDGKKVRVKNNLRITFVDPNK